LRRGRKKFSQRDNTKINKGIRAPELRVVGPEGENFGVLSFREAMKKAEEANLDLIEISPNAKPPVAKIMDYGLYRYEKKRKAAEVKSKAHVTETKSVQVKIGTGEHDQQLKARRAAEWLNEGHRVKVDLFLWGRYKYMEPDFLKERLERFLKIIPAEYKIADEIKKSPKGFTTTLERLGKANKDKVRIIEEETTKKVEKKKQPEEVAKSKKKDLDELLEIGMS
jgi:translation initiation factor IF-3